jgi:hypothetical protein
VKTRLITISDVVLGYGSPQIVNFSESLCQILGSKGLVCQPLVPQRKIVALDSSMLNLETLHTTDHPYTTTGLIEYTQKCARIINHYKPDVLVISNYSLLSVIDSLEYRPQKIIHLALEDFDLLLSGEVGMVRFLSLTRQSKLVDLWVFPEANRARHDASRLNIDPSRISIVYNVSETAQKETCSVQRQPRIIYAGMLDVDTSVGHVIFDEDMAPLPVDVYGDLQGNQASKALMHAKLDHLRRLGSAKCHVKWFGQVPGRKLDEILPSYSFSLIYWRPIRHALLNAAPNKFFQAVAAGVPVISAPHPQMKMLIERYGCGLLLDGWEKGQLISGLHKARRLIGSSEYDELKSNCRHAVATELSWQVQIDKWANRFNVKDW